MRKLATIRKIDTIINIKGRDFIELAVIGGWSCIVKKGEFEVGSLGVFFEIDSFLPYKEPYLFLGKPITHQGNKGYRIRTMKMAGVLSQGLLLPFNTFPDIGGLDKFREGYDITELLGIIKYDIELTQQHKGHTTVTGKAKGKFPSFIPKSGQERIQNLSHYFDIYKDTSFQETLKLDGSSITIFKRGIKLPLWKKLINKLLPIFDEYEVGVCSRNLQLDKPNPNDKPSNFWIVAEKYNILEDLPIDFAIQGEVLAPNIQGNFEKVSEPEMYIFDVYDIKNQQYLQPDASKYFVSKLLPKAKYVPVVSDFINIFEVCNTYDKLQERVTGASMNQPLSEGRVYKAHMVNGERVTFKCISNKYLLKSKK